MGSGAGVAALAEGLADALAAWVGEAGGVDVAGKTLDCEVADATGDGLAVEPAGAEQAPTARLMAREMARDIERFMGPGS